MKIKYKIALSIGLLLITILFLGTFTVVTMNHQKINTEMILKDNYNSICYAEQMMSAVSLLRNDSAGAVKRFDENFRLQSKNITEREERDATEMVRRCFQRYVDNRNDVNLSCFNKAVNEIVALNINAIYTKSRQAEASARTSLAWTFIVAGIGVLIAMLMLWKIPSMLVSPLQKLMEGIVEIANYNYAKKLEFPEDSEFAPVAESFNNMARKLSLYQKSSMAKIISTKQYLETVINAIDEPILGLDENRNILFANKSIVQIVNIPQEKLVDQSALQLSLSNDLLRRLIRGIDKQVDNNEPLKIYADNKESFFEVHYLQLPNHSGTIILLNDITRFKELDNAKTNFISVISHELKTPISAILMSLNLLNDQRVGTLNEEQKELSKSIEENSDRLLKITSELLKMTQVESGALQLNMKVTKPIELIEYAIKATRILAERFCCNIEVECPSEKMPKLFVDSEKIAWVVTNLLSNAIHYSKENGRIIVGTRVGDKEHVEIYVKDFGRGIDPRYHKTIFDRYFRIPGTKVQGSGLGLAISKDFVEAHGGTIWVESEINHGSCFIISLPVM